MTQPDPAAHRTAVVEALGVLGSGPEERFDRITRMTQEAFGVPLTFLNLVHGNVVTAQSTQGWRQGGSAPAEQVFCSTTVLTNEPMVVPDALLDPRFRDLAAVTEQGIRFYAGAPLSMLDGTRVGTLCIMDATPRELSAADLDLLRDLARWAERELGHAIDRDRVTRVLEGLVPGPVEVPGHDLDTLVLRTEDGGGDVADWRLASDGALHVTMGSVAAAGRASGLLASAVRGAVVARTETAMQDAIGGLEAQITADLSAADAVGSLFHLRLDPTSGHVVFGDAGHGLAVLVRADGTSRALHSLDLPLGLQPESVPRSPATLDLAAGDRLVVCTEGVLALEGIGHLDDLAALVAAEPTGAAVVERVRALVPAGAAHDVTLVVLGRS
ncbi:serine phosphatase RsbU (regulator of sigma subunit) [Curtobacterium sp. PhB142]|uniref:PP2C family protein-serine/threonine phosphatase n=1 Tax=unclassified Curtobacterium TaxID=257496 RepID=UPI00104791C8|nr:MULTISPECIES: GAF domain-containing protein [unclassified Curtobacterium]TCL86108.1 serine phosphatase RsbU (regulator of sigma subunit) [Curtobacterium sp. PhB142]TCM02298.1 serine phosphatase RsbU (regulator of sigma subunit) [Curtobacterium sp. PhB134]